MMMVLHDLVENHENLNGLEDVVSEAIITLYTQDTGEVPTLPRLSDNGR